MNILHVDTLDTLYVKLEVDTLDTLEKLPVNEKTHKPLHETRLTHVTIHANPIADAASKQEH